MVVLAQAVSFVATDPSHMTTVCLKNEQCIYSVQESSTDYSTRNYSIEISGNHVPINISQYGDICPVVSSCLDPERLVVLFEVFLESEQKHNWLHHYEYSCTLHKRLLKAEDEIQDLKAQIANQRASWEIRFMELQKRQQDLRDQLYSEIVSRTEALHKANDSAEISETFKESDLDNGHNSEEKIHGCSSGLKKLHQLDMKILHAVAYSNSLASRSTPDMSASTSVGSWKSGSRLQRVFVPHSPMDLQIGHKVRVLLPTGRISTGTLRYLGQPHGSSDYYLGVELELAENVKQTGTYDGQCYFDCKPGHGAFVAFSKLLLAWE